MIQLNNITKTYLSGTSGEVKALCGIDLSIADGEMCAVMGVSGSGKSTLLNLIGCLDRPTEGEYILDGENTAAFSERQLCGIRNKKIGFVLQDYGLIEDKTVLENVTYPLVFSKNVGFFGIKKKALAAIERVGIGELAHRKVSKLSGGQKQRAAAARAIVNDPKIILADEPTAALDRMNADEIMKLFKCLNTAGTTVVIVTHDRRIAEMCGRICCISEGIITEEARP